MKKYWMVRVLKGCAFVIVASVVLGFVVKGLWNALIPGIMGGPQITYWQALGLFVLSKILFGGFHRHGGHGGGRGVWKERMRERWAHMSDEDREKFRAGMHWGRGGWAHMSEEEREKFRSGMGRGSWCGPRPAGSQKVAEPQV